MDVLDAPLFSVVFPDIVEPDIKRPPGKVLLTSLYDTVEPSGSIADKLILIEIKLLIV